MSSAMAVPVGSAVTKAGLYRRVQMPGGHQQPAAIYKIIYPPPPPPLGPSLRTWSLQKRSLRQIWRD
jgi:hypothetical protein